MTIHLDPDAAVAHGSGSLVFNHPEHDKLLIKVFRSRDKPAKVSDYLRPTKRRFGAFREWYVEYEHYLRLLKRTGKCPDYLPRFYGFENTNLGPGQLVEKIVDVDSGRMSRTVSQYLRPPPCSVEELHAPLVELLRKIQRDGAVFRDLNLSNICVVMRGDTPTRLVVVDGLGEFTMILARSNFRWIHSLWMRQAKTKLETRIAHAQASVTSARFPA
ncbi:YrbL family protein [Alkalilacustris brevis]|uniref:YrbL family protein n=1 Tax=Alkalilacustris brevis TaxID=2026338 RepID=UPI000E0DB0E1|nr:YrbL family protein [Alkalilacustris brevis]